MTKPNTLEAINHFMPEPADAESDMMILRAYTYAVEHRRRYPAEFAACNVTEKFWLHLSSLVEDSVRAIYVL